MTTLTSECMTYMYYTKWLLDIVFSNKENNIIHKMVLHKTASESFHNKTNLADQHRFHRIFIAVKFLFKSPRSQYLSTLPFPNHPLSPPPTTSSVASDPHHLSPPPPIPHRKPPNPLPTHLPPLPRYHALRL